MNFQFIEDPVLAEYPNQATRPSYRPTFMFQGFVLSWDTAPVTSEDVSVFLVIEEFVDHEFLLVSEDPSTDALEEWFHMLRGGPIAVSDGEHIKITYPNSDDENSEEH